ncbi:uncharacterized protein LOC124337409 [Daphnia pulicaria]|uniref:uncharacterized protein LOC124337409 n=1 Tax=Daphnia pulicaria TaxID=35523 RepID=UPI001EEC41B2|nr:uncharacterized protein LOC124337409 [Daphnia pulicaria]
MIVIGYWMYRRQRMVYFNELPTTEPQAIHPPSPTLTVSPVQLLEIKARGRFSAVWKSQLKTETVAVKIFPLQEGTSFPLSRTGRTRARIPPSIRRGGGATSDAGGHARVRGPSQASPRAEGNVEAAPWYGHFVPYHRRVLGSGCRSPIVSVLCSRACYSSDTTLPYHNVQQRSANGDAPSCPATGGSSHHGGTSVQLRSTRTGR